MKHQKPLAVRIFIRICVVFMAVSLIWVYVVYMFAPNQEAWEESQWIEIDAWTVEVEAWIEDENNLDNPTEENLILPEIDSENPEDTGAPILVTEDWDVNELDEMVEVQLENGETELVRQWDLWDAISITQ